jgi:hypothetical protein
MPKKTASRPDVETIARRSGRIDEIGDLLEISTFEPIDPASHRYVFLIEAPGGEGGLVVDSGFEMLDAAREVFRYRGDWDFDPNPPPPMVIDLDDEKLAVREVTYHNATGMKVEGASFALAPMTPSERTEKLLDWVEFGDD